MKRLIVITRENNEFIDVIDHKTPLLQWAIPFIMYNDNDIEYWEGGTTEITEGEIIFRGDNGILTLKLMEAYV